MEYLEKFIFRTRKYTIEELGIQVEDNGIFKSTRRFYKYENIGNELNYTRDEIASKVLLIIGLIGSSIYLSTKYEIIGYILGFAFISFSISLIISILKNTSHIGTISFRNSNTVNDTELYLKSDLPFSNKTQEFIDSIRDGKIENSFKKILKSNQHGYQYIKQNYISQLTNLRTNLQLTEIEFQTLQNRLNDFFIENNIQENHNKEE